MKRLKSFEELDCLLTEGQRKAFREWEYCKNVLAQRPCYMRTQQRVLPYIPSWMKKKVVEVRELFDCNNTSYGGRLLWNHVLTLSLDKEHEITFAILDDKYCLEDMKNVMWKIVEVYKDLQQLYRQYGHSMSIVSLQTDDFGMYLPPSFYNASIKEEEGYASQKDASYSGAAICDMMHLSPQWITMMEYVEESREEFLATADEERAGRFKAWYERHRSHLMDCYNNVCERLRNAGSGYYVTSVWNCIDIFMDSDRRWGREFCFKFDLEESLSHLEDLKRVRPLIDSIIEKTQMETFAFGVKKKGADVQISDRVSTPCEFSTSLC